ncbi:hypothetical protein DPEC_G00303460 [Dallia pectoralis]|uniref:Uncharacterized protein n=1 Tax=Dallia pectoralis TaxID=75939 RepID=A0ACC2FD92_DALPE|nr:hypothetical protein DPEC_G00303460 [Dallia pectoralis]
MMVFRYVIRETTTKPPRLILALSAGTRLAVGLSAWARQSVTQDQNRAQSWPCQPPNTAEVAGTIKPWPHQPSTNLGA